MFGYFGKILHLDLTSEKTHTDIIDEDFCKTYIGGTGFLTRLLYDNAEPKIGPFDPHNILVFANGPFTGTCVPCSDNYVVGAKSPLTGFIGESVSSSFWAHEMKNTGIDGLTIRGRSKEPRYVFIDGGTVEFRDASNIWGRSCLETERLIKEEFGDESIRVVTIGVAGENLVRFASISSNRQTASRTGLGAVMGSKKLKAIAVRGNKTIEVAKIDELIELSLDLYERCQGSCTEKYRLLGTAGDLVKLNQLGCLPTRNFQEATFESAEEVSGENLLVNYVTNIAACSSCPVACIHNCTVKKGVYAGTTTTVEYGALSAFGPLCGINDLPTVLKAIELCDHYGLDPVSTGNVIAWAMECYETGLLTQQDVDGLELKFGSGEAAIKVIDKISARDGIGEMLAEGAKRASDKLGKGSHHFAMHVKGLELPGYDLRGLKTAALACAVAARGGCPDKSGVYDLNLSDEVDRSKVDKGVGKIVVETEGSEVIFDSLSLCKYIRKCFKDFYVEVSGLYNLVTDFELNPAELREAGERIIALKKAYNVREGWTRKDDILPQRIMKDAIPDGMSKGFVVAPGELNLMIGDYYSSRGWTKAGLPKKGKLMELELDDIAEEMGVD